jgi:hypothetical protein
MQLQPKTDDMVREDFHPIKHTKMTHSAVFMSLVGLAVVWQFTAETLPGIEFTRIASYAIALLAVFVAAAWLVMYALKAVQYPQKVGRDLVGGNVCGCLGRRLQPVVRIRGWAGNRACCVETATCWLAFFMMDQPATCTDKLQLYVTHAQWLVCMHHTMSRMPPNAGNVFSAQSHPPCLLQINKEWMDNQRGNYFGAPLLSLVLFALIVAPHSLPLAKVLFWIAAPAHMLLSIIRVSGCRLAVWVGQDPANRWHVVDTGAEMLLPGSWNTLLPSVLH